MLEAGEFEIAVGASSRDLRLTATVDVAAPPLPVPLDGMSTLEEWLADPDGAALLREAIGTDETGRPRHPRQRGAASRVIGNFPLSTLAAFPGLGLDHETIDTVVRGLARTA